MPSIVTAAAMKVVGAGMTVATCRTGL